MPRLLSQAVSQAAVDLRAVVRGRRVTLLLIAVALLSAGDLYLTLTYLSYTGMAEGNPLARLVIGFNSPALLIAWKLATVAAACCILFGCRRRLAGEAGAWVCVAVMTWLTFQWEAYIAATATMTPCVAADHERYDARWVRID